MTTQTTNFKDTEIVRARLVNPDFDHAQMNDAMAAFERLIHQLVMWEALHAPF